MGMYTCMNVHVHICHKADCTTQACEIIIYVRYEYMYNTSSVITQDGWSALIRAASEGHTKVVSEMVKANANLDLQDKVCDDVAVPCTCMVLMYTYMYKCYTVT